MILRHWFDKIRDAVRTEGDERLLLAAFMFLTTAVILVSSYSAIRNQFQTQQGAYSQITSWVFSDTGKTFEVRSNSDLVRFAQNSQSWRDSKTIEVSTLIPVGDYQQPGLYLDGVDERFEVIQNGQRIYEFGMSLPDDELPGTKVHVISLLDETDDLSARDGVSKITVRMKSSSSLIGFYGIQAYGGVDTLRVFSVRHHFGQLAVAVLCFFAFAVFLVASLWNAENRMAFVLYSSLCLVAGAYFLGQSRFGLIFMDQPLSVMIANRSFVFLLNIVIWAYFEFCIAPAPRAFARWAIYILCALLVVTTIASAVEHTVINQALRPWQITIFLIQAYIFGSMFIMRLNKEMVEEKSLTIGISVAIAAGFHDVLMYMGVIAGNGIGYGHWGGFAVIASFGWMLAYRSRQNQIAMREFTQNLQDKVAERTADLQRAVNNLESEMKARNNLEILARNTARQAAVADLSRGLAHEINNPLTILNGYAHVIKTSLESLDTTGQNGLILKSAGEIMKMSDRISRVVRGLLEFSEGNDDGHFEPVGVLEITESLNVIIAPMLKSKDIALDIVFSNNDARDQLLKCRPIQIKQILVNLVTNAIDAYSPDDPDKKVEIIIDSYGEWVTFTVADHGCGISKAIQKRIFEPFVSTKSESKGTGLGLSVAHGLARANGGRLSFISVDTGEREKRGTRFTLALPILQKSQQSA